jgi:hypothetical protein
MCSDTIIGVGAEQSISISNPTRICKPEWTGGNEGGTKTPNGLCICIDMASGEIAYASQGSGQPVGCISRFNPV